QSSSIAIAESNKDGIPTARAVEAIYRLFELLGGEHMRTQLFIALSMGLLLGWGFTQWNGLPVAQSQEAKQTKESPEAAELDGLKASATEFEKAFNAGDAKAIAAQFTENAEAVDEDGEVIEGRDKIEARFAELFKDHPKAKIEVELTSLRKLSP